MWLWPPECCHIQQHPLVTATVPSSTVTYGLLPEKALCCYCPLSLCRGPGCSSVGLGFLKGNGPFTPVSNSTMLLRNDNAFTTFANVLWLEQPAFVGFSSSNDEADRVSGRTDRSCCCCCC